jgi:hypothetical protein
VWGIMVLDLETKTKSWATSAIAKGLALEFVAAKGTRLILRMIPWIVHTH